MKTSGSFWTRRKFLGTMGAVAGGVPLGWWALRKAGWLKSQRPEDAHYFLFYFLLGGWDLLLATEPRTRKESPEVGIPYDDDEIIKVGNFRFGPAMGSLAKHHDIMSVVNGIEMLTQSHTQGQVRICTGYFIDDDDVYRPSVQAIIAAEKGKRQLTPNFTSSVIRPMNYRAALDRRCNPISGYGMRELADMVDRPEGVLSYQDQVQAVVAARDKRLVQRYGDGEIPVNDQTLYAGMARQMAQDSYRERVDDISKALAPSDNKWKNQAQLATRLVAGDLATTVTIGSGEFDAHNAPKYRKHPADVRRGLDTVASMVDYLRKTDAGRGRKLIDHTTVVVTSEFSRHPKINELGGKHHLSTNSVILIGKGIKHGKVLGAADGNLGARAMNVENGSLVKGATQFIDPRHVLATILAIAKVDPKPHVEVEPLTDLLA